MSRADIKALEAGLLTIINDHPKCSSQHLAYLKAQETKLIFDKIDEKVCLDIGLHLLDIVDNLDVVHQKPVVIDIELNGRCIFHYAMPGSTRDNEWWIERKKKTVNHFGLASYHVGRILVKEGKTWSQKYPGLDEREYAAHGGCFPIRIQGQTIVGTITMSGLAQVIDHACIVRTLIGHLQGN